MLEYNDFEKAEFILKRALSIEGLQDREEVLERLMNLYNDTDRMDESREIEGQLNKFRKNSAVKLNNLGQAVSKKVGRNDPCPCGSGKKYKKCCGA